MWRKGWVVGDITIEKMPFFMCVYIYKQAVKTSFTTSSSEYLKLVMGVYKAILFSIKRQSSCVSRHCYDFKAVWLLFKRNLVEFERGNDI